MERNVRRYFRYIKKIKNNLSSEQNIDDLKDSIKAIKENVSGTINNLIDIIENTVNDEEIKKDTLDVVNNLRKEISNMVDSTKDKVSDVINFDTSIKNLKKNNLVLISISVLFNEKQVGSSIGRAGAF